MKILLFKTGAIGDTIMTTPLVRQLRRNYPNAKIDYMIGKNAAAVLEGNKNINEIIKFDPNIFFKKQLLEYIKLVRDIRKRKYDVIFVLDKHKIYHLTAKLMKISQRVGFDRLGKEGTFLTHKVYFDGTRHEIYYYLDLLKKFGGKTNYKDISTEILVSSSDRKYARNVFTKYSLKSKKIIVLAPGGANNPGQNASSKIWPKERYSELIKKLSGKYAIILLGDRNDSDISSYLTKNNVGVVDLCGKTTITQTAAIMSEAYKIICNDTGPMHIATCVNNKIIALFGPTNPKRFSPLAKESKVLFKPFNSEISNDIYGRFNNCKNIDAITNIRVEDVIKCI